MTSKKHILLILLLGVFALSAVAQEKKVIVHKQPQGEKHHKEIYLIQDGDESDSVAANIIVHRMPRHEQKAARIVIKKSGFFKKNKIIIDFNPMTKKIIKVLDNEKEMPEKKFHKYQEYLEDATELASLEALHPVMEEMDLKIELGELPSLEGLEGLDSLIVHLEALESAHAIIKKKHYKSIKQVIRLDNLAETIQNILAESGATPPQKIETISIEKGKFFVNGDEIIGDTGQKCLQAYMANSDLTPEDMQKKGEEISIKILFD
ncbi:MAG: hypothetical protein ISR87_00050 [Candidatus Marinimicrobia bacterium]|nr:hypothetical protein [FCB group bacterium]MBL7023815.1 hypothetical protein [Candidatus Neomarinimicrobiota bacterium]